MLRPQRPGPVGVVDRRRIGRGACGHGLRCVQEQHRHLGRGQLPRGRRGGEQQRRGRVAEHELQAFGGLFRVQRKVGGAGHGDGEDGDDQFGRPLHGHRDQPLRSGAAGEQQPGQAGDLRVQLGEGQRGVLERHRRGVRRTGRLLGEEFRQRGVRHPAARSGAAGQRGAAFGRGEQCQPADRQPRIIGDGLEELPQPFGQPLHQHAVEHVRPVVQLEQDARAGGDGQAERIVVGVAAFDAADAQSADRRVHRFRVDRIVLEHDGGVEERSGARQRLDLGQSEVLVRHESGLLVLDPGQQGGDRFGRIGPDAQRQRVEQQADHAAHPVEVRRADGDGGAGDDVGAAGERGQQQAPHGLDDGVERDAVVAGDGVEPCGQRLVELERQPVRPDRIGRGVDRCDERRLVHSGQRGPPGVLGGRTVLSCEPAEVVAVRGDARQGAVVAAAQVEREEFAEEERGRPAVQQDVVVGHHQPAAVGAEPDQQEADQRGLGEVEPAAPVGLQDARERGLAPVLGLGAEVDLVPRHTRLAADHLDRPVQALVTERGAQVGVAAQQAVGRAAQCGGVDLAFDVQDDLHRVDVRRLVVVEGVEQQPFLER